MIFFVYQSKLCIATLVFYTCIYLPLMQAKRALLSILGFVLCLYHHPPLECSHASTIGSADSSEICSIELSMRRYGDLKANAGNDGEEVEACSVCLVEFESEDMVSQLPRCGHVFHMVCIEKWVERSQFTCPLCRSLFLSKQASAWEPCNVQWNYSLHF